MNNAPIIPRRGFLAGLTMFAGLAAAPAAMALNPQPLPPGYKKPTTTSGMAVGRRRHSTLTRKKP